MHHIRGASVRSAIIPRLPIDGRALRLQIITDCIPYSTVPSNAHVMLAMVQGQPPGSIESLPKVDMPFRQTLDVLQDLIPDCWNNDPTKRPLSSHILQQLHSIAHPQANPEANTNGNEEPGDGDDSRTYCYCDRVSDGEMIGCDYDRCQREWVSFQLPVTFILRLLP